MGIPSEEAFGSPQIRISSNFDIKWFEIAVEHERAALEARERAVAAADGSREMARAFDDEQKAAMVAITAAAFALDALYVKLNDLLEPAERIRAGGRVGNIVETFKLALVLGAQTQGVQTEVPALFDLRDKAVHFRAQLNDATPHPTGKSNVAREALIYSAERATGAVDLALRVLIVAYSSPRPAHRGVVEWVSASAHVPALLQATREIGATSSSSAERTSSDCQSRTPRAE